MSARTLCARCGTPTAKTWNTAHGWLCVPVLATVDPVTDVRPWHTSDGLARLRPPARG